MEKKSGAVVTSQMLKVFETVPHLYLILSPQLIILTASDKYLILTGKERSAIAGKYIFDVFPESPEWAKGKEGGITRSLRAVLRTGEPDEMEILRFDVPHHDDPIVLQERYWKTAHTPVKDEDGNIIYIIHDTADVTETVKRERALRESIETEKNAKAREALLRRQMEKLFFDVPAQIALLTGPDLVFEYINPQYKAQLLPDREVLGKSVLKALPEVMDEPVWRLLRYVYETGEATVEKEMHIPLAATDGGPLIDHYFNLVYQPLRNEDGTINGVLSFKYEITELVEARKRIEKSHEELLSLHQMLVKANEETQSVNEELVATGEELQASNEELSAAVESLHRTQEALKLTNERLEERVKERTSELALAQLDALRQRDRLKAFFMEAPAGICVLNGPDFVYEIVNPVYQRLLPGRNLLGCPLFEALPELKDGPVWDILHQVYHTGKTYEGNELLVPLARREGGELEDCYFNVIYQARHDADGTIDGVMVFCFEVTEMVRQRQKEQENERIFRFMFNAIPQQIWTAQPDGYCNYVNNVICNDSGKEEAEIINNGWHHFIHPDDLPVCKQRWQYAVTHGTEYLCEFRILFADGTYKWHLGRALPMVENNQITLWVGTNTNIEVQKVNEHRKDEFLSIASHELRTPLTSIKAFNQLMQRSTNPEKIKRFTSKSAEHISRLEKLINDLLDVTRINAGKMMYDMQPFNFADMLHDNVESMQLATSTHQIILEKAVNIEYNGDRSRLEQVVNNFLSNAIKYSPEGKKVIVNSYVQDENIIVSVRDFGIGIEAQHLHKLFDRYYRIDNTAMRFDGLGLGLFISAEILKRHYGSFWIESEPGKGSTFYFRLPLNESTLFTAITQDDEFYESRSIRIQFDKERNLLESRWQGFQNFETVKSGCLKMLEMTNKNKAYKLINDNTQVQGSWSEAVEWVSTEFFPMLEEAGVRFIAWIYSPSIFSQLSAQKSAEMAQGNIETQFFFNEEEAYAWLAGK